MKKIICILCLLMYAQSTMAWGVTGHRVIGEIADQNLSKKARKKIRTILGNESIAISSNWADFIKSDTSLKYLDPWHYVNIKGGLNQTEFENYLQSLTNDNAYTKMEFLITELKNKSLSLEKQQFYLKLLIHILGDIHQPMHVGHAEDLGGNRIRIMWFNENTNLHALWDDRIIDFQKLSYTEYVKNIHFASKSEIQTWQNQAHHTWFYESYLMADLLYKEITQPDQKLGYKYNYDHIKSLNQRLLMGGIRLAGVLNEIFA
jgi:hypothetical protein